MKTVAWMICLVLVAGLAFAPNALAKDAAKKTHDVTAEVVSVDIEGKTITIKDDKGETKTAPVLESAEPMLKKVKPGQKVTLTCQDNEMGEHQAVSGIKIAMAAKY